MKNKINGLNFRTLQSSIKTFEIKGHSYIHLNAINSDLQVLDCKKVSDDQYIVRLKDCHSNKNYLLGINNSRYHVMKRWENDIQR